MGANKNCTSGYTVGHDIELAQDNNYPKGPLNTCDCEAWCMSKSLFSHNCKDHYLKLNRAIIDNKTSCMVVCMKHRYSSEWTYPDVGYVSVFDTVTTFMITLNYVIFLNYYLCLTCPCRIRCLYRCPCIIV